MPISVFAVVLLAATMHAAWNAIVKNGQDKVLTTILVATSAAVAAGVAIPFLDIPARASHPYIAASVAIHVVYFVLVASAYRAGDMGQTYPLMRGVAPFLVALVSATWLGEALSAGAWLGVFSICLGILAMMMDRHDGNRRGIYIALTNAAVIASYTLIDGAGARLSGAPGAYASWVFMLTGVPLAAWVFVRHRTKFLDLARVSWQTGLIGGTATVVSYALVLWAMTHAPVAVVAALRETAILFGTAIAAFVLKERLGPARIAGACLIGLGAIALRLA
ncbi:MAG TPA: EamA family transporter [Hyphomicrobium sp.]|nr:EamA family transporter [Hyphomicrobium sp.]HET6390329.1 EamA family transporter [Hyphomicrobium sp.]